MKHTLTLLLIIFSIACFAQTDSTYKKIEFSDVVKVDSSISPEELYRRAKRWFGEYFNSGKDVIQIDERTDFEITGRGWKAISYTYEDLGVTQGVGKLWFKVNIYCKQGRYKYVITDFTHEGSLESKWPDVGLLTTNPEPPEFYLAFTGVRFRRKVWQSFKEDAKSYSASVAESIKKSLTQPSPTDNW